MREHVRLLCVRRRRRALPVSTKVPSRAHEGVPSAYQPGKYFMSAICACETTIALTNAQTAVLCKRLAEQTRVPQTTLADTRNRRVEGVAGVSQARSVRLPRARLHL